MKMMASETNKQSRKPNSVTKWNVIGARWMAALAFVVIAAEPAFGADVFIDEGDTDFNPTPVSSPATAELFPTAKLGGGKAPASEAPVSDVAPANPGADLDAQIGQLEPADSSGALTAPADSSMQPLETPAATPSPNASATKSVKKSNGKSAKKDTGKAGKKKSGKSKKDASKKASKKSTGKSKKKKSVGETSKPEKRKVASVTKFAGGQYAMTSKDCPMESAPGAGDVVGTSKASRKLWVEESGNTSYWKVFGKSGQPAYVPRDCF